MATANKTHKVEKGDNLSEIAAKYGVSLLSLMELTASKIRIYFGSDRKYIFPV